MHVQTAYISRFQDRDFNKDTKFTLIGTFHLENPSPELKIQRLKEREDFYIKNFRSFFDYRLYQEFTFQAIKTNNKLSLVLLSAFLVHDIIVSRKIEHQNHCVTSWWKCIWRKYIVSKELKVLNLEENPWNSYQKSEILEIYMYIDLTFYICILLDLYVYRSNISKTNIQHHLLPSFSKC